MVMLLVVEEDVFRLVAEAAWESQDVVGCSSTMHHTCSDKTTTARYLSRGNTL
jgi:predicted ATP-grasp superfamily ATP-dependent carboligase